MRQYNADAMIEKNSPKVLVLQVVIPHYRVGVFETIARSDRFDYSFVYGLDTDDSFLDLSHIKRSAFDSRKSQVRKFDFPGIATPMYFQSAELSAAFGRYYDVLMLNPDFHIISHAPAAILARLRGKKIIYWGHGVSRGGPRPWLWRLRRITMKLANAVLLYGEREYEYYAQAGVDLRNVFVTHNALDTRAVKVHRASASAAVLRKFRADKGLAGHRVMIFTGRLFAEKRLDIAIDAMPGILQEVPTAKLVIIGDGPEAARLRCRVTELGLKDSVVMPGAIFDERELAMYYMCADLAVCPGAVGLMVNHAFMYGVPVLTSDRIWLHGPEIAMVQHGQTGVLFADMNRRSYVQCAARLLGNAQELARMGRECLRLIEDDYNERAMAKAFDEAVAYALRH